jgi:hypothetical protein
VIRTLFAILAVVAFVVLGASACGPTSPTPPPKKPANNPNELLREALLNVVKTKCTPLSEVTVGYKTDEGAGIPPNIIPCSLNGSDGTVHAIAWQSDCDVDCDGGQQQVCKNDPAYQPDTSATTSTGAALDANTVPFVVVPLPRPDGFSYTLRGIELGDAAYVIYQDKIVAGVFGDEGPADIIGEASYAMNQLLGIDPDPVNGGADSGVTFIVFTGANNVVNPIEDHDKAESVAKIAAEQLIP